MTTCCRVEPYHRNPQVDTSRLRRLFMSVEPVAVRPSVTLELANRGEGPMTIAPARAIIPHHRVTTDHRRSRHRRTPPCGLVWQTSHPGPHPMADDR